MTWNVVLLEEVEDWLLDCDDDAYVACAAAIDMLEENGPSLGRPFVDLVKGGKYKHLKELRPLGTNVRLLFLFDPQQTAVLVVAGDKSGQWKQWYKTAMKLAEARYEQWLAQL